MTYERVPVRDEYVEGDEMVVMTEELRVVALSPMATHVLLHLSGGPASREVITEMLVRCFGDPPRGEDVATMVGSLLTVMSDTGLIRDLSE
jgi:hypothetical protein